MKKPQSKLPPVASVAVPKPNPANDARDRVQKCHEEVKAVMAKYRCQFSPAPVWRLQENNTWGTIIELSFRALP